MTYLQESGKLKDCYPKERVIYDARQVTSPDQLVPGNYYIPMHIDNTRKPVADLTLLVTEKDQPKVGWFKAKLSDGRDELCSMADKGIISYGTLWNNKNFLMPVDPNSGKVIPLNTDKVNPHALYVEIEYVDGAADDHSFAWHYYGPFNNAQEVEKIKPLLIHRHKPFEDDDRTYIMTHIFNGDYLVRTERDPKKIVSPQTFLTQFKIDKKNASKNLEAMLKEANNIFEVSNSL